MGRWNHTAPGAETAAAESARGKFLSGSGGVVAATGAAEWVDSELDRGKKVNFGWMACQKNWQRSGYLSLQFMLAYTENLELP
jgi:hypothetical protein